MKPNITCYDAQQRTLNLPTTHVVLGNTARDVFRPNWYNARTCSVLDGYVYCLSLSYSVPKRLVLNLKPVIHLADETHYNLLKIPSRIAV